MRPRSRERFRVYTEAEFLADPGVGLGEQRCSTRAAGNRRRVAAVGLTIGALGSVGAASGAILLAPPRPRALGARQRTTSPIVVAALMRRGAHVGSSVESGLDNADRAGLGSPRRRGGRRPRPASPAVVRRAARARTSLLSRPTAPSVVVRPTVTAVDVADVRASVRATEPVRVAHAASASASDSSHGGEFGFER